MKKIRLDWKSFDVFHVQATSPQRLKNVLNIIEILIVDPQSKPQFCSTRSVPCPLQAKLEQELERLETAGIFESIQFLEWAAPIVPVVKQDGAIRVCGD